MNGAKCSQCAAPLDPTAEKCPYCGLTTPYAQEAARRAADAAIRAQEQQRAWAHAAGANQLAAAESRARTSMWTAIGSLVTCCGPVGLVAMIMGFTATSMAKKQNAPAPAQAKIAIGIGGLSMLVSVIAIIAFTLNTRETNRRIDEIANRLRDRRAPAQLDQRLACELVEEWLLRKGYEKMGNLNFVSVACLGPLEANATSASLKGIHADFGTKKFDMSACYARGARWFVLDVGDRECAEIPVPGGTNAKLAEHELDAQESVARAEFAKRSRPSADNADSASATTAPARSPKTPRN